MCINRTVVNRNVASSSYALLLRSWSMYEAQEATVTQKVEVQ